jgi:hypothetical protein
MGHHRAGVAGRRVERAGLCDRHHVPRVAGPDQDDWEGLLQKANPKADANALMEQTGMARKIVRREIWQVLEQTDPPAMGSQ